MIYYLDKLEKITDAQFNYFNKYCIADRQKKVATYHFRSDQIQSVMAYVLLRVALQLEYGINDRPEFEFDKNTKPHLAGYDNIQFNLSHCKCSVVCALSSKCVGVDVQEITEYDNLLAQYFMTPMEYDSTRKEKSDLEFTRIWTLKESYGKYVGNGICYNMKRYLAFDGITSGGLISKSYSFPEYIISSTSYEEMELKKMTVEELVVQCSKLDLKLEI